MSPAPENNRFFQIMQSFEIDCIIWYAAPYSTSEKIRLPVGMNISVSEKGSTTNEIMYEVVPVDSKDWSPFVLSVETRYHSKFRGEYNFFLDRDQLEKYCREMDTLPEAMPAPVRVLRALHGCLIGTAVADAIGLPFEGLSSKRINRLKAFPLRHRFLFGKGMISDDTEHTCMVAQALINSAGQPERFQRSLGWKLRWWVLGLPAGIGLATLRACMKLCLGVPPGMSGVFSAGNGPAMRSAILGVYADEDYQYREQLVRINTVVTHRDPKATRGAMIVAEFAARNAQGQPLKPADCLDTIGPIIGEDKELMEVVSAAIDSAARNQLALEFCQQQGWLKGVSGYMYHTLPVVIQIVLRHAENFEDAITEAVSCGGDTDTVAAIIGGIVGAGTGEEGVPEPWLAGLNDWPRNKRFIRRLAEELAVLKVRKKSGVILSVGMLRVWIRNLFFMVWVLGHGFRRLLPPY